jgi:hypothetical protein
MSEPSLWIQMVLENWKSSYWFTRELRRQERLIDDVDLDSVSLAEWILN